MRAAHSYLVGRIAHLQIVMKQIWLSLGITLGSPLTLFQTAERPNTCVGIEFIRPIEADAHLYLSFVKA